MGRTATYSFEKYEGLGNDFLVVEASDDGDVSPDFARMACDRRSGVGGDGVLVILPARTLDAQARMRVINADGSIAEMCGNGLRCAALHLARKRGIDRGELTLETDAGTLHCTIDRNGDAGMIRAEIGFVRVLDDVALDVGGDALTFTRVDAGNPHAVAFRQVTTEEFERLGPAISTAKTFERGVNVEFVRVESDGLTVLVWERGAGPTLACGTGACAAVAAARAKALVPAGGPVVVRLPGGALEVTIDVQGKASLYGPARRVFCGTLAGRAG